MNKNISTIKSAAISTKFAYIDIAKAIGILAVVFAHINVEGGIYRTLYSFHIPLFFILAGMTFKGESQSIHEFMDKKVRRLLLPYLVYSLITFAWYALVEVKMPEFTALAKGQTTIGAFMEIFLARGSVDFLQHNPALWFIPCLFVTELIYFGLSKCKKAVKITGVLLLGAIGCLFTMPFIHGFFRELPWQTGVAFVALPFLLFGEALTKKVGLDGLQNIVLKKKWISCLLIIVGIAAVIALTWANGLFLPIEAKGHISMGSKHLGNFGIFYVNAILGSMAVIALSILLAHLLRERIELHKSGLVWLGERSLPIMAIHYPVKRRMVVIVAQAINAWHLAEVNGGFTTYTSSHLLPSFIAFIFTMVITVIITIAAESFTKKANLPGKRK
ncbi:MAG: acyltransferase family protein [Clostridia bacterium]|nr:acyltransferase family protein [Clostridia bacterium]